MSIGKLQEFKVGSGVWSSYLDRVQMYFKVNEVAEDMKLPTLIATMGDEAYELLENLASPTKPANLTMQRVDELMRQHLQPAPSVLAERYRFRLRRQKVDENIATYITELKRLAKQCKFGTNLNENLRDQFVCGVFSDVIRQRLFTEDDTVTVASAVKIAMSLEAAERNAAIVEQTKPVSSAGEASAVQAIMFAGRGTSSFGRDPARGANAYSQRGAPNKTTTQLVQCDACGARSHNRSNCRFRDYVCSKCQRTGHLRRVCPEWGAAPPAAGRGAARAPAQRARPAAAAPSRGGLYFNDADREPSEEYGGDIEQELHHLCLNNYQSVSLPISIDKAVIKMEIDTGTAISCVSKATYDLYFTHLCIQQDDTVLKFYDGSNQIELDDSKRYTVINTHRGLFQYNRLVYGLSSSVGIFQRIMTNLLGNIPNVQVFLDDVIIGGNNMSDHLQALEAVFQRLLSSGLKLKKSKCVFLAKEVTYLGYVVSREGIKPDTSKIMAIQKMKQPQNVSELRSFLGTVNFFGRFIRNLSSTLSPLYDLLRKGVEWCWDSECSRAFTQVKQLLLGAKVLAHYDPGKRLIVTCDASPRGVGAVLTQEGPGGERPVAFASRTLNSAEANYSQIHREALAIIFCVKKFHQYLYGRHFTLRTDHKPLVSIFGPNATIPTMTASRMQRWAIILSAYDYDIEYVSSSNNCADSLSRLPDATEPPNGQYEVIPEQTYLHFAQDALLLNHNEIKKNTLKDPVLARVLSFTRDGWPEEYQIESLKPYFNRKSELYEELGCVMWGHRVVIPDSCRDKVLKILHEPHMGIVKTKALARSYVWWPGVDEAVEAACRACATCAALASAPPAHAPRCWPWPGRPWARLHIDFLGPIYGKTYLVIVDAMSKWVEVFQVPSTAAGYTIDRLSELWARWGIPKQIVSDNGPPFSSREFQSFLITDGVEHIFTAPYHPASNGAAENSVRTIKLVIKKAVIENREIQKSINNFLLYYRNTEHCSTGESPAMLLMGRRLRTRLDILRPTIESKVIKSQQRQIDAAGGSDRTLGVGEDVWYRQYLKGEKWQPGKVTRSLGSTDYNVTNTQGDVIHRHIDQLRRRVRSSMACPRATSEIQNREGSMSPTLRDDSKSEHSMGSSSSTPLAISPARSVTEGESEERFSTPEKHISCVGTPAPPSPPPDSVPNRPRPLRQCRLVKPQYKL